MENYDELYDEVDNYFGSEPDSLLESQLNRIDPQGLAIDIGAGQGRNSLYLAQRGVRVVAIDPSAGALDKLAEIAREKSLPIQTFATGFGEHPAEPGAYSTALVFGVLQSIRPSLYALLAEKLSLWLKPGGLAFITSFTTEDPAYPSHANHCQEPEKNCFVDLHGNVRTYLEPGEMVRCFKELIPVHLWEGLGELHRHGDGPEEQHARVEAILQKPA